MCHMLSFLLTNVLRTNVLLPREDKRREGRVGFAETKREQKEGGGKEVECQCWSPVVFPGCGFVHESTSSPVTRI